MGLDEFMRTGESRHDTIRVVIMLRHHGGLLSETQDNLCQTFVSSMPSVAFSIIKMII
jgi:hypothetical protein